MMTKLTISYECEEIGCNTVRDVVLDGIMFDTLATRFYFDMEAMVSVFMPDGWGLESRVRTVCPEHRDNLRTVPKAEADRCEFMQYIPVKNTFGVCMPRARMIRPSILYDVRVQELSAKAQLVFIYCFLIADDDGRFLWDKHAIWHQIPVIKNAIQLRSLIKAMTEIEASGMIVTYEVSAVQYAYFPNWHKHQTINRPTPSTLPAPPGFTESITESITESGKANSLNDSLNKRREKNYKNISSSIPTLLDTGMQDGFPEEGDSTYNHRGKGKDGLMPLRSLLTEITEARHG
jgi:hypothetical protein